MKDPILINKKNSVTAYQHIGMSSYVKNSIGQTDNIWFYVIINVNTEDNICSVRYQVNIFTNKKVDCYTEDFTDYSKAVDKYNELAIKWNGYRE